MPLWSELTQSFYDVPDYYSDFNAWKPDPADGYAMIGIATALTLLRLKVQSYFQEYAKQSEIKKSKKFAESMWKSIFYSVNVLWGLKILLGCDWFPDTTNCYKNFPYIERTFEMRAYMVWQMGFYLHSLYSHFFIEIPRSDYWPLLGHHVATLFLVYSAHIIRYERIGLLVLLSHDVNDLLLEMGKVFVYKEWKNLVNLWFALIMISWVALRLVFFPFVIIRSTLWESIQYIPVDIFPFYTSLNASLLFLVCLHVYWFGLMIRMLVRVVSGKEKAVVDSREQKAPYSDNKDVADIIPTKSQAPTSPKNKTLTEAGPTN